MYCTNSCINVCLTYDRKGMEVCSNSFTMLSIYRHGEILGLWNFLVQVFEEQTINLFCNAVCNGDSGRTKMKCSASASASATGFKRQPQQQQRPILALFSRACWSVADSKIPIELHQVFHLQLSRVKYDFTVLLLHNWLRRISMRFNGIELCWEAGMDNAQSDIIPARICRDRLQVQPHCTLYSLIHIRTRKMNAKQRK